MVKVFEVVPSDSAAPPLKPFRQDLLKFLHDDMVANSIACPKEALDVDAWTSEFQRVIEGLIGVAPQVEAIERVTRPWVPLCVAPTRGLHYILLRTPLAEILCGRTLAQEVARKVLEGITDLRIRGPTAEAINNGVRQELMEALSDALEKSLSSASGTFRPSKRSRTAQTRVALLASKTAEVKFVLTNRLAYSRAPKTLVDASRLLDAISGGQLADAGLTTEALDDIFVSRQALTRHTILLDMALDSCITEDIFQQRMSQNFLGACIATDESPPGCPRFAGLRFQIACFYSGFIPSKEHWEDSKEPPIQSRRILAGICQSPGNPARTS